jgi:hypothetical protein
MKTAIELQGSIESDGAMKPFTARVFEPTQEGAGDYSCLVHAPLLFKDDKKIFGADADQALELSVQFLKSMLAGRHLVDENGRPVNLDRLRT